MVNFVEEARNFEKDLYTGRFEHNYVQICLYRNLSQNLQINFLVKVRFIHEDGIRGEMLFRK